MKPFLVVALLATTPLWPQQQAPPPDAPSAAGADGLTTEWNIQKTIHAVGIQASRLIPLLDDVRPAEWVDKGAPDAYVTQLRDLRAELGYAARTAQELLQDADDLGKAFELFMRLDSSRGMYRSLVQGVRTYQNPALADLLESVELEGDAPRSHFRNYLIELATMKERELKIIDQEAQRCRGMLIRQPAARPAPKRKPPAAALPPPASSPVPPAVKGAKP
ncbi:MAG: hypothetical protein IPJ98_06395 [Bryobacterales bacterium]|nr:hypothetical protein [Bryobacterales bacterium]